MVHMCQHYWEVLYRTRCVEVPFVWSNKAITLSAIVNGCKEEELMYVNRGKEKKVAIFEPNISIMKWALPATLITDSAYRKNKKIKHLYVTNVSSGKDLVKFNVERFNKIMKNLDIVVDKKCSIETRYNTLYFMKNYADVVVSHQMENPLNYLYFDLAWMGWPVVHNATLCKEIGYYYSDFNYVEGGEMLSYAVNHHDDNAEEYLARNRRHLDRFLPTNVVLQRQYEKLVRDILTKCYGGRL